MARCRPLYLLLLLLLLACPQTGMAQARYALMIACGEHKSEPGGDIPRLQAPPHDIRLMASALTSCCGFRPENIAVLGLEPAGADDGYDYRASHATRDEIRSALRTLSDPTRIRPDDYVVIYITGHGRSIADSTSPTLTREYLVTYDLDVRDDILKSWVAAVRGHVTLILDTCYSGGLIKGRPFGKFDGMDYEFVSKAVPPDVAVPQNMVAEKTPPFAHRVPPFTVLAACESDEPAQELRFHRHDHSGEMAISGFTWALYYALINRSRPLTLDALRNDVTAHLQAIQCAQHPEFRPGTDHLALLALALSQSGTQRFAWIRLDTGRALLQAGYFAGIQTGMRFAATSRPKSVEQVKRTTTVTNCGWFNSELRPIPDPMSTAGWIERETPPEP